MHSAAELKLQLAEALPGIVLETRLRTQPVSADAPPEGEKPKPRARKPDDGPVDLLATDDVVVQPDRLVEAALYLRDQLGATYLSNITPVDYLADGLIEVVYHFYAETGGPLVLKVRLARENPVVPSLTPYWPGAQFQEREAYDLYGVQFSGHPYLRRIYMWDEFEGFPMRRDFPKQGDKYLGDDDEG